MTLLEKLQETHPDCVYPSNHNLHDVGKGCPGDYEFLNTDRTAKNCGLKRAGRVEYIGFAERCRNCWAQEYKPEPVTPNQKRQAVDLPPVDTVDHPSHYTAGRFECIDEMVALFGVEAVKAFCRCNVHKYRYRADHKNGAEDLAKAEWYMAKLMELERGGAGV